MTFNLDNSSLLLDQDTSWFFMYTKIESYIFYSTIKNC